MSYDMMQLEPYSLRAVQAARGDAEFDSFAQENKKFILACAYKAIHRYVTDHDDEWSAALSGFYEAVKTYDADKGEFRPYAALVIRRRVLDEYGKSVRRMPEVLTEPQKFGGGLSHDEESAGDAELRRAETREAMMAEIPGVNPLRDEIEAVQEDLSRYGFSFADLVECSPKSEKTRNACATAIRAMMDNAELLGRMRDTTALPMKDLSRASGINRKVLDRHRRYIIAATEILTGDYPHLAEYLRFVRK